MVYRHVLKMLRAYIVTLKYGVTESGKETVWEGRDNEEELHTFAFPIAVVRQSNSWFYIGSTT